MEPIKEKSSSECSTDYESEIDDFLPEIDDYFVEVDGKWMSTTGSARNGEKRLKERTITLFSF